MKIKGDAEVGGDLLRAVHLERLARDERFERLVEARVDRRIASGLLRHVGEVADKRLKLRGAAVGLEHRLLKRAPYAGVRVGRHGIQRLPEQFRKLRLRIEGGFDRLAGRSSPCAEIALFISPVFAGRTSCSPCCRRPRRPPSGSGGPSRGGARAPCGRRGPDRPSPCLARRARGPSPSPPPRS